MDDLIRLLASLIENDQRNNYILFGSAAIALRGIDLDRPINDLDVFVSQDTFEGLSKKFKLEEKPGNDGPAVPFYKPAENIEIWKSFPGVTFSDVAKNSSPTTASAGFPVGGLDDLRSWKAAQGREKDRADLEMIDKQRGALAG